MSYKNLIIESLIPLLSVIVWVIVIRSMLHYPWTNSMWINALFLFFWLDILILFSIYPIAVLIKCLLYDHNTILEYDTIHEIINYERNGIKVSFSFLDVKSFVQIHPLLKSSLCTIYEIELSSGCVITVTDLLLVVQEFEKNITITDTYYESILFRRFYNHQPNDT